MQIQVRYFWVKVGASGLHGIKHQGKGDITKDSVRHGQGPWVDRGLMSWHHQLLSSHSWAYRKGCLQHDIIPVMSGEQTLGKWDQCPHVPQLLLPGQSHSSMWTRILQLAVTMGHRALKILYFLVPPCLFSFLSELLFLSHIPWCWGLTCTTKVSQMTTAISKAASCAESMTSKKESLVNNPLKSHPPLTNAEMKAELRTQI